jgi:hypothetical protein
MTEWFWVRAGALLGLACGLAAVWLATNSRPLWTAAALAVLAVQQTAMAARGFDHEARRVRSRRRLAHRGGAS